MIGKALVACEESQAVCIALRAKGWEAYSCDILPCSGGHPEWHIQMDVVRLLYDLDFIYQYPNYTNWDMLIAFPPCTHLAVSGAKHFAQKRKDGRQEQAIDFFRKMFYAPIEIIAVENPIGIMSTELHKPTQIIQPYQFGDPFTKTTCLWLKGLPNLIPTNIVDKGKRVITKGGNSLPEWYNIPPSDPDRAKKRSKTFPGIAQAMADQWTDFYIKTVCGL